MGIIGYDGLCGESNNSSEICMGTEGRHTGAPWTYIGDGGGSSGCVKLKHDVSMDECLSNYMEANSYMRPEDVEERGLHMECRRCGRGAENRINFGEC